MKGYCTGGPAFPGKFTNDGDRNISAPDGTLVPPGYTIEMSGMTLRDYFATQALQGILACSYPLSDLGYTMKNGASVLQNNAIAAYEIADAMLAERAK